MITVKKAIQNIKESNYFAAWEDLLTGEYAIESWYSIINENATDEKCAELGSRMHEDSIPYVIVSEYVDEIFRNLNLVDSKYFKIKNKIAQAFLAKKLTYDRETIEKHLSEKLSHTLQVKKDLINAHLKWMHQFINHILKITTAPELDCNKCTVGLWIIEEELPKEHNIKYIHMNLHAMAQSALRMYKKDDYAYFLLLYIDMLHFSYQIRDFIINFYFTKRLTSIHRDYLSNQPNYLQLRVDIESYYSDELLVMINIKEFSKFNLLYGHKQGDTLIQETIAFIISLEKVQKVYRIYGDEFAVIFKKNDAIYVQERFKKELESHEYHIHNTTILLSFYASYAGMQEHVLEHCEYGLIESKRNVGMFVNASSVDEQVIKNYTKQMTLSQKLRMAFLDDRFITYYQPIMDKNSKKIVKYEVLMRVLDINGQVMIPSEFLSILHEMYIYPEVTKVIIEKAFELFKGNEYQFSINLSFADLVNPETESFILAIVKKYPDVARRCTFELLEDEAIKNEDEVMRFFKILQGYGVEISIDDFGSGFSNYDTIFKFDVDSIKIDGTITESLLVSNKSRILLDSIITVSRELNAKITVEYVSSKEIYDYLLNLDIDMMQGYFIGRPSATL